MEGHPDPVDHRGGCPARCRAQVCAALPTRRPSRAGVIAEGLGRTDRPDHTTTVWMPVNWIARTLDSTQITCILSTLLVFWRGHDDHDEA